MQPPSDAFDAAVATLISPYWHADHDRILAPLLDQLAEAVTSGSSHGRHGSNKYRAPGNLDVLGLLMDIDKFTQDGIRRSGVRHRMPDRRIDRVRLWSGFQYVWRARDKAYFEQAETKAVHWVLRGEQILSPDRQQLETKAQPCPHCKSRTAMIWSEDAGERTQRPSLYLDKVAMIVVCRCCGTVWPAPLWGLLSKVLTEATG